MFDAIVQSNGWNDATAAVQLFHLEGDALIVALLVPESRRPSRVGLVGALTECDFAGSVFAEVVAADAISFTDAEVVTVDVTDLANAVASPLADAGMVTVGVADGADAAPVKGEGVDICCSDRLSTEAWCRERTPIRNDLHNQFVGSISCHPADVYYTMRSGNVRKLFVWSNVSSHK